MSKFWLIFVVSLLARAVWAFEGAFRVEMVGKPSPEAVVKGPAILVFTDKTCNLCVLQLNQFAELNSIAPAVRLFLVSTEEGQKLASPLKYPVSVINDTKGDVFKSLLVKTLPTTVMIDGKGVIQGYYEGLVEGQEANDLVNALRQGKSLVQAAMPGSPGSRAAIIPGLNWAKGKEHLLIFHQLTCSGCIQEIPDVLSVARTRPNINVWVLTPDDPVMVRKQFAGSTRNVRVIQVDRYKAGKDYNITGTPTHLLVTNGIIRYRNVGFTPNTLKRLPYGQP